jgi:hypothetical protein
MSLVVALAAVVIAALLLRALLEVLLAWRVSSGR